MLQSPRLKYHMKTIGIEQSLCNTYYFDHKCLNNIRKIYQHTGKCNDQQNLKDIIDDSIVYIPEEITYDSPSLPVTQQQFKKKARK